jgi:hypothetical protein
MQVKEYNEKVDQLLKKVMEDKKQIEGIVLSNESKVGINVMNINGSPTVTLCKLDDQDNPTEVIYCISVGDIESAKRLNIWSGNIISILTQKALYEGDANAIVGTSKSPNVVHMPDTKSDEKKD